MKLKSHRLKSPYKLLNQSAENEGDVLSPALSQTVNVTLSKALQTQLLLDALVRWTDLEDTTKYSLGGEKMQLS